MISGVTSGTVVEAGGVGSGTPGSPLATGDLTSTEVDNPPDDWIVVAARRRASGFGNYTVTAGRRLDLHARQQQCHGGRAQRRAPLTDTFTATTIDGTFAGHHHPQSMAPTMPP